MRPFIFPVDRKCPSGAGHYMKQSMPLYSSRPWEVYSIRPLSSSSHSRPPVLLSSWLSPSRQRSLDYSTWQPLSPTSVGKMMRRPNFDEEGGFDLGGSKLLSITICTRPYRMDYRHLSALKTSLWLFVGSNADKASCIKPGMPSEHSPTVFD